MRSTGLVDATRAGSHAVVTLNDRLRRNAPTAPLILELRRRLTVLTMDSSIRTIVLTGTDDVFSVGGDLRVLRPWARPAITDNNHRRPTPTWRWLRIQFGALLRTITRSDTPFIAAVNGDAGGPGIALALACDLVIASERARLMPCGRIGETGELDTNWLSHRLGHQRAFELRTGASYMSAQHAAELGLVHELVAPDQVLPRAVDWAERIDLIPDGGVPMAKRFLRTEAQLKWDDAVADELAALERAIAPSRL
jgi:2-(1,2-epoxy-1,2-dihydrophenyl)acetyl-CoA isomerase